MAEPGSSEIVVNTQERTYLPKERLMQVRDALGKEGVSRYFYEVDRQDIKLISKEIFEAKFSRNRLVGERDIFTSLDVYSREFCKFPPLKEAMFTRITAKREKREVKTQEIDSLINTMRDNGIRVNVFPKRDLRALQLGLRLPSAKDRKRISKGELASLGNWATVRQDKQGSYFNILKPEKLNDISSTELLSEITHDLTNYVLEVGINTKTGEVPSTTPGNTIKFDRDTSQYAAYMVASDTLEVWISELIV